MKIIELDILLSVKYINLGVDPEEVIKYLTNLVVWSDSTPYTGDPYFKVETPHETQTTFYFPIDSSSGDIALDEIKLLLSQSIVASYQDLDMYLCRFNDWEKE